MVTVADDEEAASDEDDKNEDDEEVAAEVAVLVGVGALTVMTVTASGLRRLLKLCDDELLALVGERLLVLDEAVTAEAAEAPNGKK